MTTVFVCRIIRAAFFCVMFCCSTTHARIGETSVQFADRYGAPKDTPNAKENDTRSPLVQGAIHHRYDYQGWSIRAAFLQVNGPAIRMEYQKIDGAPPTDSDRQAIVAGNSGNGMSWKEISLSGYDDKTKAYFAGAVGGKIWRRSDGDRKS